MYQLIYCSKSAEELNLEVLKNILQDAQVKNIKNYVTGVLFFNRKYFLQCLEGPKIGVNHIYESICRDKRHVQLTLLNYSRIVKRSFPNWAMGVANEKKINQVNFLKFGMHDEFDPFLLTQESSHLFLKDLCETAKIFQDEIE